jgi:RNA polymerase sigma-70 factor (ECF subfamily)
VTAVSTDFFEQERRRLFTVAYGFLGSRAEAEDVVQDAWLRWQSRADQESAQTLNEPAAWLTTVTARLALDRLRSARVKRETYPGVWLPEPIVNAPSAEASMLQESGLSLAFLFLLERLAPEERAAFVLREVFDHSYREIGEALGKPEASCRQLVKRARERVQADRPNRQPLDRAEFEGALGELLDALEAGDEARLLASLAPDAVLYGDGGGIVPSTINPIVGPERIARFLLGLRDKYGPFLYRPVDVNGTPGRLVLRDGHPAGVGSYSVSSGRISQIFHVLNPEKISDAVRDERPR